ncbi:putative bifunctional diguanylate cyclase/phosphodiesterase [Massilia sp. TSP1-1-2]|uniref:putative bifunctional diguanylate cyclase/phosphodiesterase n=1 Tax=Massilia sp. TSP1-1-2 TaxID=2804649 RepID=UPI003CEBC552
MHIAPFPADEAERLLALYSARILDTEPEEEFDRITRIAAKLLKVPIALVSLVDAERQWFKSKVGLDVTQTRRDISFCGHAVLQKEPFLISDAQADARFADNPLVMGAPFVRFYAGIPLLSVEGQALGSFCVIDHVPRILTDIELASLVDLARMAQEQIQRRQLLLASGKVLETLRESEERHRQLISHAPEAYLVSDGARIIFVNQAGMRLLGAQRADQIVGMPALGIVAPAYRQIVAQRAEMAYRTLRPNAPLEMRWLRVDGAEVDVETTTVSYTSNGEVRIQIIARDNTIRKQYKTELEQLATHDVLTGLPNRAVLRDRLEQGIHRWLRQGHGAVVAFLNLDHFKNVNDAFGHSVGDQVLTSVGKVLQSSVRKNDTVARIGNDEFVLILEQIDESELRILLQRLIDNIGQPIKALRQDITVSCSVGYCRYPADGATADALLTAADTAMYRAKDLGRATVSCYEPAMQGAASERLTMESRLRLALAQNEFVLHYQPKVDLRTGKVVGLEALVRWQDPQLGLIPPVRFIPVAEETGLIVPLGDWILRTACEQAAAWQREGIAHMPVAVNLSARQFLQSDLVARVGQIVRETGIAPHLLELELTESLSMDSPEKSIAVLTALKEIGLTLTIDDFGTGYSNLSYLKRFPLDKLKLDQSFVRDMAQSSEALAIAQAIITLAHGLHLRVVAEGVETAEQLALLTLQGCDEMQGYFFSRPLPVAQCSALLREGKELALSLFPVV